MERLRASRIPMLLAAIALCCYLPAFGWGVPHANAPGRGHAWGVDDESPLGSLAEVRGIRRGPTPGRNLGYPIGYPLVVAAASAPYLGWLAATGQFHVGSPEYPHGFADPVHAIANLGLIAHGVSLLFAIFVVIAAWSAARDLWGSVAGVFAGLITLTTFPMFYYARTGNVDMAQLAWMAGALAVVARITVAGLTVRRAVWLGLLTGAAVGTKEPIVAAFLGVPFLLLALWWRDRRKSGAPSAPLWAPVAAAAVAAALSFGLLSGLFLDSERYFAHAAFGRGIVNDSAKGSIAFAHTYPMTPQGHRDLARVLVGLLRDALTWPGLLLAIAGLWLAIYRRSRNATFIVPAVTYLAVLFLVARVAQLRYVMPAVWVLGIFAAHAAAEAWHSRRVAFRWGGLIAAIAMIGLNAGRGVDLTYAMIHDSRYDAASWFANHAQAGARIAYFGSDQKLPPLAPDVRTERPGDYRGAAVASATDEQAAEQIVESWKANPPDFVLLMPDHSSPAGVPYPASCPPSLFESLEAGRIGFRPVAFFETPPWLRFLQRPRLDYPTVNPPIRIYQRTAG